MARMTSLFCAALLMVGCATTPAAKTDGSESQHDARAMTHEAGTSEGHPHHSSPSAHGGGGHLDVEKGQGVGEILSAVAAIHGGAGPFAVAGYRMGTYALDALGLERGSFDAYVEHHSPHEVQYSCIADGLQAATGVSTGKLNLKLITVEQEDLSTTITNRESGESVKITLKASFLEAYLNTEREKLGPAGHAVAEMDWQGIFEVDRVEPHAELPQ